MNPLLTVKQVSKTLSISYRQTLELIVMGKINAYKIGNAYRISQSDLHEFLEANKFKSGWKK